MRRLFSILLLSLLAFNIVGGYLYFSIRIWQIKQEMRAQLQSLPEDQLHILTLTNEEFLNSRVDAHEIKVDGKMYDVARIHKEDDIVTVFCVHDKKEDGMLAQLDRILNNLENDNQALPHALAHFSFLHYISTDFNFQTSNLTVLIKAYTVYQEKHFFFAPTIDSPPPQI